MAKRVLVGEANYNEFEVLNDLLTARGYQVTWLRNGKDVTSQFVDVNPDLMILDALLPGMTGLKITQQVKATDVGKDVKIILMSSVYKQFKEQYESRAKLGVDAYTEKPVNVGELERLLQELMGEEPGSAATVRGNGQAGVRAVIEETDGEDEAIDARKLVGVEGSLAETSFPKLLFYLHRFSRTGALRIDRASVSKVIYFQSGLPVLVSSNQSHESLGRFLVQKKAITIEQYNASLEQILKTGRQHGEVLLEMQAITPHDLYRGLYDHVVEKVLSVFAWEDGHYRFQSGRLEINQNFTINIDPVQLVYKGIKRHFPLTRLESFFNEYKNRRLVRVPEAFVPDRAFGFGPQESRFLTLINDRRTVGQIVARSNLSLAETFQALYLLLVVESIRFRGSPFAYAPKPDAARDFARSAERRRSARSVAPAVSDDERLARFQAAVDRSFDGLGELNHYELLGVPRDAGVDQVKAAYFMLSTRFHDHNMVGRSGAQTRRRADAIFQALTNAYVTLIQPDSRRAYDHSLATGTAPETHAEELPELRHDPLDRGDGARMSAFHPLFPEETQVAAGLFDESGSLAEPAPLDEAAADEADVGNAGVFDEHLSGIEELWGAGDDRLHELPKISPTLTGEGDTDESPGQIAAGMGEMLKAELAFQQGEDALRDRDYEAAENAFRAALEIAPNEAEYHAYLGWAMFRRDSRDGARVSEAEEFIDKSLKINPTLDAAWYFLGMIAADRGERDRARELLHKALQNNPDNEDASRAIADIAKGG
ncbi:response regulator [bacterium]|nr:response regulator [bacterium]